MSCIQPSANKKTLLVDGTLMQGISISMLSVQPEGFKKLWTPFTPHTKTNTKLSLALHLANLTIIISSWFLLTSKD
jgi:hypothetical protein